LLEISGKSGDGGFAGMLMLGPRFSDRKEEIPNRNFQIAFQLESDYSARPLFVLKLGRYGQNRAAPTSRKNKTCTRRIALRALRFDVRSGVVIHDLVVPATGPANIAGLAI
jgi:hypothetical protein